MFGRCFKLRGFKFEESELCNEGIERVALLVLRWIGVRKRLTQDQRLRACRFNGPRFPRTFCARSSSSRRARMDANALGDWDRLWCRDAGWRCFQAGHAGHTNPCWGGLFPGRDGICMPKGLLRNQYSYHYAPLRPWEKQKTLPLAQLCLWLCQVSTCSRASASIFAVSPTPTRQTCTVKQDGQTRSAVCHGRRTSTHGHVHVPERWR